jgi:glycosyltransferase involved in cell wall biosynthesis
MKILLIRSRAIDPAVKKVAESLSRNGYQVELLVWDRNCNFKMDNVQPYSIHRFNFHAPYDKLSVFFYLPVWWLYELFFILKCNSDVIHACDLDTLLPAILAKHIKRYALFYTIYDFYADNLPVSFPKFIRFIVASIEKIGISLTDTLFLIDESRYQQIEGARVKRLYYIYNSPPDRYVQLSRKQISSELNTTIFYAGVIHKSRGIEYIIEALKDQDNIKLVIAGSGPDIDLITNSSPDLREKINYKGVISYDEVIKGTINADILIALYDPGIVNNRYASPNKLFEAMMCCKPIIVNKETSAAKIVETENCGITIPYGDVNALKEAIYRLKSKTLSAQLGSNGRKAYLDKYKWGIMEERLLAAYKNIVS